MCPQTATNAHMVITEDRNNRLRGRIARAKRPDRRRARDRALADSNAEDTRRDPGLGLERSAASPLPWLVRSRTQGSGGRPRVDQTNGNESAHPEQLENAAIENLLREQRTYPPDPEFTAQANAQASLYLEAETDFEAFWANLARERISWFEPFHTTLDWDLPFARWFDGGQLNVSYNCVDRHVENGLGSKVAYHWIGEPGDTRTITYADLHRDVQKAANALRALGIGKGDRVAIYMPMIPELPIAMLACARIGAPHTVVFGGFSAEALSGRINDAEAKLVITADGGWRRGKPGLLKPAVDEALESTPSVHAVLVVRRLGDAAPDTTMVEGRDHWWHDIVESQQADCPPEPLDSEHML